MTKEEAVKEIEKEEKWLLIAGYSAKNVDIAFDKIKSLISQLLQEPCEDAIRRTDMLDAIGHGTTYTSEGLQRIIKGLPPVNPQPCPNAISSDAVLLLIQRVKEQEKINYMSLLNLAAEVRKLPPVNPQPKTDSWSIKDVADTFKKHGLIREQEPKTGHWIYGRNSKHPNKDILSCSECGSFFFYIIGDSKPNYCGNCGARMNEPQESEK